MFDLIYTLIYYLVWFFLMALAGFAAFAVFMGLGCLMIALDSGSSDYQRTDFDDEDEEDTK